ncbi:uncharacterized protein PG986_000549 [Apiospora aurea]|uniref:Rhodopsin domain-containing protein n=1 Tax=Apiospora aurea TaxID=335848 RepID=A0ABR1QUU0_9PEZI
MSDVPDPDIMVVAASWTFATLATISLGLRIWCRMYRVGTLWWDDLVLGLSVFVVILTAACITAMFRAGWSADPVPHGRPVVLFLAASSCAAVAAGLSKTAYMVTLLRLTTEPWTRRVLSFFVASLNVVLWFSALACWARLCEEGPSRVLGNAYTGGPCLPGQCWPERYVVGAITASLVYSGRMDLTLALFPWGIVRNLQMHKRHKIGISTSMSVSALYARDQPVMYVNAIISPFSDQCN